MPWTDHRENSRVLWGKNVDGKNNTDVDDIILGCHLRVADALELMSKNHAELVAQRNMYERWYNEKAAQLETERRRTAALRGMIARMKRAAAGEGS